MPIERWLPTGYLVSESIEVQRVLDEDVGWQLYSGHGTSKVLVAEKELADRWVEHGLLEPGSIHWFEFGSNQFAALTSGKDMELHRLSTMRSPQSKSDASALAVSLRESRKIDAEASFHDAIYVERFSRLLPSWTISSAVDDEYVLGRWLTGGVPVSATSVRRVHQIVCWLKERDIADIASAAGFQPHERYASDEDNRIESSPPEGDAKPNTEERRIDPQPGTSAEPFRLLGRPYLEEFINEHVVDIVRNEERYKALGIDFPSAIVLHGPPGCGKTYAVERLVEYLDWPEFHIDASSVGSPYIHETSKKVAEVFEKAMDASPAVVVIDEMESFLSDRQRGGTSSLHHVEEVAEFLRRIPEAVSNRVLIVGMTNKIDMIDPAIIRRGRFDHIIEVGMPSAEEVASLLSSLISKMPTEGEMGLDKAIKTLSGRPLSDAAFVVREAGRLAARSGQSALDQESFDLALNQLPDKVGEEESRPIGFIWN
tara:strand:- start:3350 stop:4801 length:1452 start_codon:yes stop_codon:yes gene_type:complete